MTDLETEIHWSISDVNSNSWDHIVNQSDVGGIYNTSDWLRVVEETHNVEGRHILVKKKGNPVAIFPNFKTKMRLPYSIKGKVPDNRLIPYELASINVGYGGPIIQSDETDSFREIMEAVDTVLDWHTISHYIRPPNHDYVRYTELFDEYDYSPNLSRCRFEVSLNQAYGDIFNRMDKSRRRNLRNGYKNDPVTQNEKITKETINEFYDDYLEVMSRVGGEPKQKLFFERMNELCGDQMKIVKAIVDGETVGRHLYLLDHDRGTIHHEISGVPKKYFEYNSSELIHEHVIQWGIIKGFDTFDFGPTPSDYRDGLFKYKEKYGGKIRPIITWEKSNSVLWPLYKRARSFYKKSIFQ